MNKEKKKNIELDVDFIGSQEPLTVEEQNSLSEYFNSIKSRRKKLQKLTSLKMASKSQKAI
jgi:hypothetical protein